MHPSRDFDRDVLPVVKPLAKCHFRNRPNRAELVADAISVAWEFWRQAPPAATPQSISRFAILRVKVGRQFREKRRSITAPRGRLRDKPAPAELEYEALVCGYEDPADIAQMLVDVEDWRGVLSARKLAFLEAFLLGERTTELAERFNVSMGRVSQIRGELVAHWQAFTG